MLPKIDSPVHVRPTISFLGDRNLTFTPNHLVSRLHHLETIPGLISLLAGRPNPDTFPLTSFTFTARSPVNSNEETVLKIKGNELAQGLEIRSIGR